MPGVGRLPTKFDGANLSTNRYIERRMIIPIRCMNCGKCLAELWRYYQAEVAKLRGGAGSTPMYMDGTSAPVTPEGQVLDKLGLTRYCCRKHMLTQVDLIEKVQS
jgi:DNA-directed RNA polymerase I, II, and III subunit RPABC5